MVRTCFVYFSSLGVPEASHLKMNLRRAAFAVISYRDMNKSFRQRNLYSVAKEKEIKESVFHMDFLHSVLSSLQDSFSELWHFFC